MQSVMTPRAFFDQILKYAYTFNNISWLIIIILGADFFYIFLADEPQWI